VARCAGKCEAGYADPPAPQRISPVLALEIEADRTTVPPQAAPVDPRDVHPESELGQERITNEWTLKLGIRVSPRTVGKYLRDGPLRTPDPKHRWLTFVYNHAKVIVACHYFVVVTATFRTLYAIVILELATRRNAPLQRGRPPTTESTLQQLREALAGDHPYRFVIHDRDRIFSQRLDQGVTDLVVRVLRNAGAGTHGRLLMRRFGGTLMSQVPGLPDPT
jgi:hypothetical protein